MKPIKFTVIVMAILLLTSCGEAKEDSLSSETAPAVTASAENMQKENAVVLVYPPEESTDSLAWQATGSATVQENTLRSGKNEVVVSGRKSADESLELDITPYIEEGKHYNITSEMSFTREQSVVDTLSCEYIITDENGEENTGILGMEKVKSYRKINVDENLDTADAKKVVLRWYLESCADADIHVTSLEIKEVGTGADAALSYESMDELAEKHGFTMGAMINPTLYEDDTYCAIVEKHFSSLTASNEMKAYSLLDQTACIKAAKAGDDDPKMDFDSADTLVQYAADHGMGVRGHCLVWDAYMCEWFFNEGYEDDGKKVSKAVMKKRLRSYIKQVVEHFDTKFPGVVYCWDVVNEAVGDSEGTDYDASDSCHIRTTRNGGPNLFYRYVGKDYVKLAFQYAREYASADTKLFYNDYNNEYFNKRNATVELVKELNKDEKLVDGVGMQAYFNMEDGILQSNLDSEGISLEDSVKAFSDLGVEVHLTEVTVRNFDKSQNEAHGDYYYRLFRKICELNEDKTRITNVSIWGLMDTPDAVSGDYVYSQSGTYYGIWDKDYQPKEAFSEIIRALSTDTKDVNSEEKGAY